MITALIVVFATLSLWLLVTAVTAIWFVVELVKLQNANEAVNEKMNKGFVFPTERKET